MWHYSVGPLFPKESWMLLEPWFPHPPAPILSKVLSNEVVSTQLHLRPLKPEANEAQPSLSSDWCLVSPWWQQTGQKAPLLYICFIYVLFMFFICFIYCNASKSVQRSSELSAGALHPALVLQERKAWTCLSRSEEGHQGALRAGTGWGIWGFQPGEVKGLVQPHGSISICKKSL